MKIVPILDCTKDRLSQSHGELKSNCPKWIIYRVKLSKLSVRLSEWKRSRWPKVQLSQKQLLRLKSPHVELSFSQFLNRLFLKDIRKPDRFWQILHDFKTAITFERREIQTWFLHIFHKEFNFQQFWKNKISKIFDQKNFGIFWGSFLENLLMGSSDDPTQKTIHCVHIPMADPKIPNFCMEHDITN